MPGLWDLLFNQNGQGGLFGAAPSSDAAQWMAQYEKPYTTPRLNMGLYSRQRPASVDPFGRGAEAQSLYGKDPSGFGFQPPVSAPDVAAASGAAPPVALLENRPPPLTLPTDLPPPSQPAQGQLSAAAMPLPQPPPQYRPPPQMYAPPQAAGPDIGGNLMAGFQNLLSNPTLGGLGQAITGFQTGARTDPIGAAQQNATQTYRALLSAGYSHADAALAATNPIVLKQLVENAYQRPEFKTAGPGEAAYLIGGGLGRLGPGAPGVSGVPGAGVTQLQPGMSVQEKAAQEAAGQKQGQAAAVLPQTLSMADNALRTIDQLRNHPGKGLAIGALGLVPPVPGTAQGDFVQKLKQAQGQIFVSIFNQLRGGGAISDKEGEKGTEAAANLSRAQSPQAFDQALGDLRNTISKGREVAIKIARGETQPFASPAASSAAPPFSRAELMAEARRRGLMQ